MDEKRTLNWAVAAAIREAREAANLTQVELADFAGLSKPYVSGLERGNCNPSMYALIKISGVLNMTPSGLMRKVEDFIKKGPQKPESHTGRPKKKKNTL